MKRREDLTAPRSSRRIGVQYNPDAFGNFSESIANRLGTARYLVWQTVIVGIWIIHNAFAPERYQFDSWARGLVLLTLVLSIQASYAAPLILLAQSRQERRDRISAETDRDVAERTQADTEFLAREIASVRVSLTDMVTGEDIGNRLDRIDEMIEQLAANVDRLTGEKTQAGADSRRPASVDTGSVDTGSVGTDSVSEVSATDP